MNYRVYVLQNDAGKYYIGSPKTYPFGLVSITQASRAGREEKVLGLCFGPAILFRFPTLVGRRTLKRQGRGSGFYSVTGLIPPGS